MVFSSTLDLAAPHLLPLIDAVGRVLLGKEHQVRLAFSCLLAGGHLLIEDLPGMGKSTLAEALARVFALAFKRVSFTSDLLPADLTGLNVFNPAEASFRFQPGPLFTQVLLADEINRASPRTQSALLEAMAAGRVSVDGVSHALPKPFFVIAPQNGRCSLVGLIQPPAARALSLLDGRDHVVIDDVQAVLPAVVEHRLDAGCPARHGAPHSEALLRAVPALR